MCKCKLMSLLTINIKWSCRNACYCHHNIDTIDIDLQLGATTMADDHERPQLQMAAEEVHFVCDNVLC